MQKKNPKYISAFLCGFICICFLIALHLFVGILRLPSRDSMSKCVSFNIDLSVANQMSPSCFSLCAFPVLETDPTPYLHCLTHDMSYFHSCTWNALEELELPAGVDLVVRPHPDVEDVVGCAAVVEEELQTLGSRFGVKPATLQERTAARFNWAGAEVHEVAFSWEQEETTVGNVLTCVHAVGPTPPKGHTAWTTRGSNSLNTGGELFF